MIISPNHVVAVSYHLTVPGENGVEETVEKTDSENPLVFLFGAGQLLPDFEMNLQGKVVGDSFDFRISPENGYGIFQQELLIGMPIHNFLDESGKLNQEMIFVGNRVPFMDEQGNRLWGKISKIGLQEVQIDFNHPLAGKELHFVGQVAGIRHATAEEMAHGHAHGLDGHQHHH